VFKGRSPHLNPILSHLNVFYTITQNFFKILFNISILYTLTCSM
jgi:hypothetical protein